VTGVAASLGWSWPGAAPRVHCRVAADAPDPPGRPRDPIDPIEMSKLLRGLAAGYGAKKLGGGCFSTVLIFILLWWLLGNFGLFR
jgi:hypothetical protein